MNKNTKPTFAVIMCTYKRLHILEDTLKMLNSQTDTNFDLIIWNNNQGCKDLANLTDLSKYTFHTKVINYEQNIGGVGRFYAGNANASKYDFFIMIDDDQMFDSNMISIFKKEASQEAITGWWAWKIDGDYHRRRPLKPNEDGDYIGTGGIVLPSFIFQQESLFKKLPKKYLFIEDLWLSFFAKYELGLKLRKSKTTIGFIPAESKRDQHHRLKDLKNEFYRFLVATYLK